MSSAPRLAIIGLGYVGLPLAVALARHFPVLGFDVKASRIAELRAGHDRTGEIDDATLKSISLDMTADPAALKGRDVYIITVPTPVDADNKPDLGAVIAACRTVGAALGKGAIVVLESTVYPGVTEDICGPELAAASGLVPGRDFFLGYSPERINPGDREHTVTRITKVVAGQTPGTAEKLAKIYGKVTSGGVFVARDIKTAEAAKVIENAQRDINIAFINEVTMIFNRLGLSVHDVLDASRTKWNFLPFTPGLVGGHCIGVDPFYLADLAQRLGRDPAVILAGRRINDAMGGYVADCLAREIAVKRPAAGARVLVLGLTFKENVPDLRNSKVVDVIRGLAAKGCTVDVHDPLADPEEAREEYGIELMPALDRAGAYDAAVGAVPHDFYRKLAPERLARLLVPGGLLADIKGMWRTLAFPASLRRWQL
ncbi:MAG: nucleotide sugar dehydrogenase [Rhodospirillales bacterium]|nr:nucleotide sugar dehydrogenase [Rhodospirillales bacterium]